MNRKPDVPEPFDELYLSPVGQDRARHILGLAIREAARRRRRRRRHACQSAALALLAAAGLSLWTSTRSRTSLPPAIVAYPAPPAQPPATPAPPADNVPVLTHIYTDPNILTRLRITPQPPQWQTITDDQLLATLASAGHPAAIVPLNGKPTLLLASSDKP